MPPAVPLHKPRVSLRSLDETLPLLQFVVPSLAPWLTKRKLGLLVADMACLIVKDPLARSPCCFMHNYHFIDKLCFIQVSNLKSK